MNGEPRVFLTADDLYALTGYKRAKAQVEWLRARGWIFELDGDERPVVLRKYAEARMGGAVEAHSLAAPDFSAIR